MHGAQNAVTTDTIHHGTRGKAVRNSRLQTVGIAPYNRSFRGISRYPESCRPFICALNVRNWLGSGLAAIRE